MKAVERGETRRMRGRAFVLRFDTKGLHLRLWED